MAPQVKECDGVFVKKETTFGHSSLADGDADADGNRSNTANSKQYTHLSSTVALCICTLAHSWLLISVFPYSGFMAVALVPGVDEENAGSYAGLLASAFMAGRAGTSYAWGKSADVYGRKFVLIASLGLSCLFSLLFGLSPTFGFALLWRFLLGMGNGIIGTAKTTVSEIARGNENLETRGMGLGE
jgi:MFS family permease